MAKRKKDDSLNTRKWKLITLNVSITDLKGEKYIKSLFILVN